VIISRHVVLDESSFPFAEQSSVPTAVDFEFLDDFTNVVQAPIGPPQLFLPAGSVISGSPPAALPRAAPDAPPPAVSDPLPRAAGPCSSPLSHCHVRPPARLLRLWATCCRMQQGPLQPSPAGRGAQQATSNAPARRGCRRGIYSCCAPRHRCCSRSSSQRRLTSRCTSRGCPPRAHHPPHLHAPNTCSSSCARCCCSSTGRRCCACTDRPLFQPCRRAPCLFPLVNQHGMTTRAKHGFRQPALLHTVLLSPVPKTLRSALADPNWRAATEEEHAALRTIRGISSHVRRVLTLSPASGSSSTNFSCLMGLLSATRLGGFFVASHVDLA
jgi:hypothetical protein